MKTSIAASAFRRAGRPILAVLLCALGPNAPDALLAQADSTVECRGLAVSGSVTDGSGLLALPGATIRVRWLDVRRRPESGTSAGDGRFTICAPGDALEALVWAEFGDYSSEPQVVLLSTEVSSDLSLSILIESGGTAKIVGRVFDAASEDGVPAAVVEVAAGAGRATTDRRGNFVITGIRPGLYPLRVRHLGYADLEHDIQTQDGRTLEVQLGLTPTPVELEPLVVTVLRSRKLEIRGFYERRYWHELLGLGTFYTADDIDRRRPLRISHMIADVPGVKLKCSGSGIRGCSLENSRVGCEMNAYLDGVNLRVGRGQGGLDEFVLPVEIAGVEVYQGAAQLPAEYAGSDARCGAVVIWTR